MFVIKLNVMISIHTKYDDKDAIKLFVKSIELVFNISSIYPNKTSNRCSVHTEFI